MSVQIRSPPPQVTYAAPMIPSNWITSHPGGTFFLRGRARPGDTEVATRGPTVEETGLRPAAPAERGYREPRGASLRYAGPAAAYREWLGDVPGVEPLSPHAGSEAGVVEPAAPRPTMLLRNPPGSPTDRF